MENNNINNSEKSGESPKIMKIPRIHLEVPAGSVSEEFWRKALYFKFIYSITGLLVGFSCMIIASILFLNGIYGSSNWTASVLGIESNLNDAAPGTILFVIGFLIIIATRLRIKTK